MPKNKKPNKKSTFGKLNTRRIRGVFLALFAVSLIGIFTYFLRQEDFGPQQPPPPADAIYKQTNKPINERVKDLLTRMTLEEKIGQMSLVDKNSLGSLEDISKYNLGGILSGAGSKPENNSPQGWLDMVNGMKRQAEESRLGIPILYGIDANHGHSNVLGATIFPHAIGLGASNDPKLIKEVAEATSQELVATGINWSYSPSLDAPKDMRWGRVYEAFSDSSSLNGKFGEAFIEGTQKSTNNSYVLATAKHFLGNGAMEWGASNHKDFKIDQGKTLADESKLNSEYLIPYKAAVDAGVSSVMVGLNQWGNERVIDSEFLITDKLKGELGFKGFVVSDWYGVYEYSKTNRYNANVKTLNAGLDMAMLPYDYKSFLKDVRRAVNNGDISQQRIDDAVGRILYQKFKAGLFDTSLNSASLEQVGSQKHHELARKAVASSAVLLKNKSSVLPLSKSTERILVAGSGADNVGRQSGAWTVEWQGVDGNWMPGGVSILQGIKQVVSANSEVDFKIDGNFENAVEKSEIGIVVVSEKPYAEGWGDNDHPAIEKEDLAAIANMKKYSEKIVVVILSGRPLIITDEITGWDAAIAAWLPGSQGAGIADVLFGNKPFTAKLPIVWPSILEQVPTKDNGSTSKGTKPLFERGFGLF